MLTGPKITLDRRFSNIITRHAPNALSLPFPALSKFQVPRLIQVQKTNLPIQIDACILTLNEKEADTQSALEVELNP